MDQQRSAQRRVVIRVAAGPDPLRGSVDSEFGVPQDFTSWLGLISALRRILASPLPASEKGRESS